MEVVQYSAEWLPGLGALARAHARLVVPGTLPDDVAVARGLDHHLAWPFYSPGMDSSQVRLVIEDGEVLAAAQLGISDHGRGYGAADGDGPDWIRDTHAAIFWLFAWPGVPGADRAAAMLGATMVRWARAEGLPGLEAFRGGPGFLQFGAQCSSRWPHLWAPMRSIGFRQPRPLIIYAGQTDAPCRPDTGDDRLPFDTVNRRGRIEAWFDGTPCGVCDTELLGDRLDDDLIAHYGEPRSAHHAQQEDDRQEGKRLARRRAAGNTWAHVRRLWVDRDARGIGVGTALMQAMVANLSSRGVDRWALHLPDGADIGPAHGLYSRFGRVIDRQYVMRLSF
jgi:GNAT superfamily N-acetyltransferase